MAGTVFAEFAPLYRAGAQLHIPPRDLDCLELWEVAAVLGVADPPSDDTPDGPRPHRARRVTSRSMLHRRIEAANAGAAPPSWGPPSPTETVAMTDLLAFGNLTPGAPDGA